MKNEGHPQKHTTIDLSFIGAIKAATAADYNKGIGFVEIYVKKMLGVMKRASAARLAEAARAQPKRRRTTILVHDEPPPADEDARDDNDPSAPAVMHVPAHGHGEYNKRKCFGINKQ